MKLDSNLERDEYRNLLLRQAAHEIEGLEAQVVTRLMCNGAHVANYKIDFAYIERGIKIWKECKGYFHEKDRLRFKMFIALTRDETNRIVLQNRITRSFHEVKVMDRNIYYFQSGKWRMWRF